LTCGYARRIGFISFSSKISKRTARIKADLYIFYSVLSEEVHAKSLYVVRQAHHKRKDVDKVNAGTVSPEQSQPNSVQGIIKKQFNSAVIAPFLAQSPALCDLQPINNVIKYCPLRACRSRSIGAFCRYLRNIRLNPCHLCAILGIFDKVSLNHEFESN
jgi:hypothetical protein